MGNFMSLSEGIKFYKSKNYTQALNAFLSFSPKNDNEKMDLAYYIGLTYTRLERYEEAILYLEQIVTTCTDKERVLQCSFALAIVYAFTGREKMAQYELEKLEKMDEKTEQVLCAQAFLSWKHGDEEKAIQLYEQVLEMNEENYTALNGLGYILADTQKNLTKALFLCKKAVDENPNYAPYLDSLGWVYYNLGLMKEAKSFTQKALKKLPNNEEINYHLQKINGAMNEKSN